VAATPPLKQAPRAQPARRQDRVPTRTCCALPSLLIAGGPARRTRPPPLRQRPGLCSLLEAGAARENKQRSRSGAPPRGGGRAAAGAGGAVVCARPAGSPRSSRRPALAEGLPPASTRLDPHGSISLNSPKAKSHIEFVGREKSVEFKVSPPLDGGESAGGWCRARYREWAGAGAGLPCVPDLACQVCRVRRPDAHEFTYNSEPRTSPSSCEAMGSMGRSALALAAHVGTASALAFAPQPRLLGTRACPPAAVRRARCLATAGPFATALSALRVCAACARVTGERARAALGAAVRRRPALSADPPARALGGACRRGRRHGRARRGRRRGGR